MMKYTHAIAILLWAIFFISPSYAQNWVWSKGNTGASMDAWPVATDKNGNVFTAGIRWGTTPAVFGTTAVPISGSGVGYQCIIAKYDAVGNFLWAKGTAYGEANLIGLATDPSGNVYMLGTMYTTTLKVGAITLSNTTTSDAQFFLVKYDPSGNVLWATSAGNTQLYFSSVASIANLLGLGAITTDAGGNVYMTVNFHMPTTTVGAHTLVNTDPTGNTDDILMAKYDPSGNLLWVKGFGGNKHDDAYGIAVTPAGDIYLAGAFNSPSFALGPSVLTNGSAATVTFIARFDASGNPVWGAAGGGSDGNYAAGIAADAGNSVYIVGGMYDAGLSFNGTTVTNPVPGRAASFLVKFDPANNVSWYKVLASPRPKGSSWGYAVATASCGEVWISGAMAKADSISDTSGVIPIEVTVDGHLLSSPPASYDPLYIAGFTSSGTYVGGTTLQSGGDDQVGLASDAYGGVFLSGDYVGKVPFSIGSNNFPVEVSSEELLYIAKFAPRNPALTNRHSDTTMCFKTGMMLYADGGYSKYTWNDGQSGVSHSVTDTGIFWVSGSDSCAAFVSDTFRIRGVCDCDMSLFVPNTFTPNGDGQNDVFYPRCGSGISKVTRFQVYNRWGTLLFERENISPNDAINSWDGSFQGSLPLPDVYIYVVDAICENGKVINKKGSVTVIR